MTTAVIPIAVPVLWVVCVMSAKSKMDNYAHNDKLMRPGIGQIHPVQWVTSHNI